MLTWVLFDVDLNLAARLQSSPALRLSSSCGLLLPSQCRGTECFSRDRLWAHAAVTGARRDHHGKQQLDLTTHTLLRCFHPWPRCRFAS